jgi:hypothetical protein
VREVRDQLAANRLVLRTDVKSYYAFIDHLTLLDQLAVYIKDRRVLNLVGQYLRRTAERGGGTAGPARVSWTSTLCRSIMQLRELPNGSWLLFGEHATKVANHRLPA